jgi:histidinol dehydrogenase
MKKLPKIIRYDQITKAKKRRLFNRSFGNYRQVITEITPAIKAVADSGDSAILKKYSSRDMQLNSLRVSKQEFRQARQLVEPKTVAALQRAKNNIETVCKEQRLLLANGENQKVWLENGTVAVWRRWQPIEKVGIYVPGGRANYPSTLLMCAVPARLAGCAEIAVCAPPRPDGSLPPEVLVAAELAGVQSVYKVGGAQAIAAFAYGTQTITKVDLVVGPANQYVTAAKLALFPTIQIDMPAGPSENLIIADDSANPNWVAADLITDCEHGPDSTGVLVTTSRKLALAVQQQVEAQLETLPTATTIRESLAQFGAILIVSSLKQAVAVANEYGPEHMQIMTVDAEKVAQQITCAGSIFVGQTTAKAAGDYITGANHVLPTGGLARTFGPLSVENFGRWMEFQSVSAQGAIRLAETIKQFSSIEALPAHGQSGVVRLMTNTTIK